MLVQFEYCVNIFLSIFNTLPAEGLCPLTAETRVRIPVSLPNKSRLAVIAPNVILGEVNGKLPPEQRHSVFFVNLKLPEIMRKHARLYPKSLKRLHVNLLFALGATIGVVVIIIGVIHYS